jgi:ubiquinone biosynthesis protein
MVIVSKTIYNLREMHETSKHFKFPGWWKVLSRAMHVFCLGGVVIFLASLWLLAKRFQTSDEYWDRVGRLSKWALIHLGGAFTKAGQVVSTRYDILPAAVLKSLHTIQDQLPPFDGGEASAIIERTLKRPIELAFASFDRCPVASGTIAQVHYAIGLDGKQLAVKVRRPGICELFEVDTYLLVRTMSLISTLGFFKSMPLIEVGYQIGALLREQTDLQIESQWQRQFAQHLVSFSEVTIPRILDDLCGSEVLTMEFLPGLRRLDDTSVDAGERRRAILEILRAVYSLIFQAGLTHCDLHPGNMRIFRDTRAVLLDFGFCGRMSEEERRQFSEFFLCMALNDGDGAANIVEKMVTDMPPDGWNEKLFRAQIQSVIAEVFGQKAGDFLIGKFVLKLFAVQRQWKLRSKPSFVQPLVTLMVFEGIVRKLFPDLDFQREALPFILRK